jgi:hypothetical protein
MAAEPLKVSDPACDPKLFPVTVTDVPTLAKSGLILVIMGAGIVNDRPVLASPLAAVTTTIPVVAEGGTAVLMLPSLQLETVAAVPLNVTVPLLCEAPK